MAMPIGNWHSISGILRQTDAGYALETQDRQLWRLELGAQAAQHQLGRLVTVNGTLSPDDTLAVRWIRFDQDELDLVRTIAAGFRSLQ
jgi:hypothetical protein